MKVKELEHRRHLSHLACRSDSTAAYDSETTWLICNELRKALIPVREYTVLVVAYFYKDGMNEHNK